MAESRLFIELRSSFLCTGRGVNRQPLPFLCNSNGACGEDAKAMTVVCCSGNVGCVGGDSFKREAILQLNRLTSA
jgi:hypothetical protein